MNEHETITDVIKGIRAEADYIEETARGSLKAGENYDGIAFTESDLESALDLAETKRKEADRLEAALKRERGDCAKLREALEELMKFTCNSCERRLCEDDAEEEDGRIVPSPCSAIIRAKDALAEPVKNCDVGTAKEQYGRHCKWCARTKDFSCAPTMCRECFANWAQMPHEEGGAE